MEKGKISVGKQFDIYKSTKQDPLQTLNEQTDFYNNAIFDVVVKHQTRSVQEKGYKIDKMLYHQLLKSTNQDKTPINSVFLILKFYYLFCFYIYLKELILNSFNIS